MLLSRPGSALLMTLVTLGLLGAGLVLARWAGVELRPVPRLGDRPFALALPEGRPIRLAVLGTSLTAGEPWPGDVADRLSTCIGHPVALLVVAKNGAGSEWGLTQVAQVAAEKPDLLLVEFAINDADVTGGMTLARSAEAHVALIRALRAASPATTITLMTMSPAQGLRGLSRPRLRAHYQQYQTLAKDMGLGLIDLYPRWLALPPSARGLSRDGLHPEPDTAAHLIAPVIVEAVAQALTGTGCSERQRRS